MTLNKAKRRYPLFTKIRYLGNKEFEVYGGNYIVTNMEPAKDVIKYGSIGSVVGYIKDGSNCVGLTINFQSPHMDFTTFGDDIEMKFGEDLFVRDLVTSHYIENKQRI